MILPVLAGNLLDPGTRSEVVRTYAQMYEGIRARIGGLVQMIPSDKLTEIYAYPTTPPYANRWPRGTDRRRGNFGAVKFTVTNLDFSAGVRWHLNDEQDDQTGFMTGQAQAVGNRGANIFERAIFQLMQSTTDADVLPAIPNAPDGLAFYSSSTRFGRASGNLLTGTGVATGSAILADFYSARAAFRGYKDTQGQPLLDDAAVDEAVYHVFYNSDNDLVFQTAFKVNQALVVVKNVAATENVAAATPTNIIVANGVKVFLHPTQRITDNKWYIFLEHSSISVKPFIHQPRQPLAFRVETMENSDRARDTKLVGFDVDWREGFNVNLPYMTIEITN